MGARGGRNSFDVPIVVQQVSPHNNSMKRIRNSKMLTPEEVSLLKSD